MVTTQPHNIDGRFKVIQSVGQSSMGSVFMVTRPGDDAPNVPEDDGRLRAIKQLGDVTLRQRFVEEFNRLRQLSHPAFVRAEELSVDGDTGALFTTLEWASGQPLTPEFVTDRASLIALAAAALRGIDHLHRHGVVHGDLAPPNLLATGHPHTPIKILDLGAGGEIGSGGGSTSGILAYAAPERLQARGLSIQSDLWSLGAVLFGLVHGCHPFPDYPRVPGVHTGPVRQGLDTDPLDPWLDRLLAAQPEDRFPTAQSALEALADLTDEDVCDLSLAELNAGPAHPPYVDVGDLRQTLGDELSACADVMQAHALTIGGASGTGRTRLLIELAHRLAGHGHRVIREQVLPSDCLGESLERVLGRLGVAPTDTSRVPMTAARALLRATARMPGAIVLMLDDVDRGPPELQRAVAFIRDAVAQQSGRASGLVWITVNDLANPDHRLAPWTEEETHALLARIYPQRRIGRRVATPLTTISRGLPGLLFPHLRRLVQRQELTVSAAAIHLADNASEAKAADIEEATEQLKSLPPMSRKEAALIAHARHPLPTQLIDRDALPPLEAYGLTVISSADAAVSLRRADLVAAAQQGMTREDAARELAARWRRQTASPIADTEAAIYDVVSGNIDAREAARDAIQVDIRSPFSALIEELIDAQWPATAEEAIAAGDALRAQGALDRAAEMYTQAAAKGDAHEGVALCRQGALEAHRARHAQAIVAFEAALTGSEDDTRAEALAGLARSATLTGRLDEADAWCREGLSLSKRGKDARWAGLTYTAGLIAWYRGELGEAQQLLEDALSETVATEDHAESAAVVTALGLVAHRRDDLNSAERHYTEALAMGEAINDPSRVLTALQNMAVVQHQRGAFAEALATYQEAFAMARALEQIGREVQLSGNLGNLWRYLGQRAQAEDVLKDGLARARDAGDRFMEGSLLLISGEVALDHGDWSQAQVLLEEALGATEATQSATERAEVLLALTTLATEQEQLELAISTGERALEAAQHAKREALTVQAHARLARCLAMVEGREAEANTHAERALAGIDTVSNPDHRWGVHLEAMRAGRRREDDHAMVTQAAEVKRLLQSVIDGVPAIYREAFRTQRERHRAWLEAESMTVTPLRVPVDSSQSRERWTRLLEVSRRMALEHNPERLLEFIMDSAVILGGAERGFLLLVDEHSPEKMPIRVARNIDQENIRNTRLKISHGIARRVVETGEPLLTVDAMEDERYRAQLSVHDLKLRSVLCLPMIVRGVVIGAIYLDNRFQSSAFNEDDSIQLQAFAGQAATALDTARLLERMEAAQAELEQARAEVEALNSRLKEQLNERTQELEATHRVVIQQRRQLEATHQYDRIIGSSDAIQRVFHVMDRLLDNTIPVLVEGESGTGKELVARAIHFNGARKDKPFVAINCGAIPSNLLESELFGHVRGAFTGATTDKLGLFEAADGGTLLLDELGELPLEMQVKLLRVLQSGEIQKVGATHQRKVDVRIVAATNRRLSDEVAAGRFREDLFYRLAVIPVVLPPLRERAGDIPLLVQHFLDTNLKDGVGKVSRISQRALTVLCRYGWPGNVRQLEMVLKNATLFAEGDVLQAEDLSSFPEIIGDATPRLTGDSLSGRTLADIEREAVIQALEDTGGNKKRAAEQLGIDRRTLYNKLAAYKIVVEKKLRVR